MRALLTSQRFLVRGILQNQRAEASQTYVAFANDEVVGFYTLVVAQVEYDDAPSRLAKGTRETPDAADAGIARTQVDGSERIGAT